MDFAVLLYFEDNADRVIHKWVHELVDLGLDDRLINIDMKPHLTLAEFDFADLSKVEKLLADFAASNAPIDIKFSSLGVFPGELGVLFLNPVVSEQLVSFHRRLNSKLGKCCEDFSPLYSEENWVPHCTLGLDYDELQMGKAYHYMASRFETVETSAVSLVLYGCCPYHEMMVFPLSKLD